MNRFELDYSNIIHNVCRKGYKISSRNARVRQLTNVLISADLSLGLPIVTGKKIFPKSCFIETEWMLKGLTNTKWLNDKGVKIWNQWADDNGYLGPVYGHQLRNFNGVDQLTEVITSMKANYNSRRHLVSFWNVTDISKMNLPPCHYSFQFVTYKEHIDIVVSMRSLDLFIGLPYDMLMYSIILHATCVELNKKVGTVHINAAAAHVYEEHVGSAATYAGRIKKDLPVLLDCPSILNFEADKVKISEYKSDSRIIVNVIK